MNPQSYQNKTLFDTNTASTVSNSNGVIDGSKLGTQSNIAVPNPIKNNVAQNNLGAQVGAVSNSAETNFALGSAEQNAIAKPDPKKGLTDRIMEVIGLQKKQGEKTLQVQEEEGVFEKKTLARKLENDIIAKTRAYEKQAEQIRLNSQGKFGGAVEQELNELDRLKNSELADMAIQYKVAAGDYNQAMEIATAKIEAEFEPLKNEIASLTQLYNLYQNDLSESEKMEVQAQIQEKQSQLNFSREKEMVKYRDQIEQSNPMFALEMKYKKAQIANIYSDIAKRNADALAEKNKANFVTPPVINPQTGKVDPTSQLTSVMQATDPKTNAKLTSVFGVISAAQSLADQNTEGKFKGLSNFPRLTPGALKSDEKISNQASIEAINLNVQTWASGASLTEQQTKQVNKITPKKGDSDNEVKKKLNALTNYMMSQVQAELGSQGIPFTPERVDFFSPVVTAPTGEVIQIID